MFLLERSFDVEANVHVVIVPVAVQLGIIRRPFCSFRGDKNTAAASSLTPSVLALPSFFASFLWNTSKTWLRIWETGVVMTLCSFIWRRTRGVNQINLLLLSCVSLVWSSFLLLNLVNETLTVEQEDHSNTTGSLNWPRTFSLHPEGSHTFVEHVSV